MTDDKYWHAYGRLDDGLAMVCNLGPTAIPPDDPRVKGEIASSFMGHVAVAYLASYTYQPGEKEEDELIKMMESHG